MVEINIPFINAQRDRTGRVKYYYFRRNGQRWRLPGDPTSEAFMAKYRELLAATDKVSAQVDHPIDRRSYLPGSFGALINDYLSSGAFKEKADTTKIEYKRVMEALQIRHGTKPLKQLRRRHVRKIRDEKSETPGAANTILRTMKLLLNFAVEEEWIESSPAAKMKLLKVGEWRNWSDDECEQFEDRWAPGTMQRRAYALALYTGQRRGDLVATTRAHRKAGEIRVKQDKTDKDLWIPEHTNLTAELGLGSNDHMSLLTTSKSKAFDPVYFGAWFAEAIDDAKLPDDCVLHGLRKTAACRLAEAGCSEEEIKAITGHLTSRMVSLYTKRADQKKRAKAAILKLENSR